MTADDLARGRALLATFERLHAEAQAAGESPRDDEMDAHYAYLIWTIENRESLLSAASDLAALKQEFAETDRALDDWQALGVKGVQMLKQAQSDLAALKAQIRSHFEVCKCHGECETCEVLADLLQQTEPPR